MADDQWTGLINTQHPLGLPPTRVNHAVLIMPNNCSEYVRTSPATSVSVSVSEGLLPRSLGLEEATPRAQVPLDSLLVIRGI